MLGGDTEEFGQQPVHRAHHRILPVEVAGLAGPEVGDAHIVRDGGRPAAPVDPLHQLGTKVRLQEIANDEELEPGRWDALHARLGRKPLADVPKG
jgi:hypothetical protein